MEHVILGAVVAGAKAAWTLYRMGFSKAKEAPRLYLEFGVAIQTLAQNLDSIQKIIQNAERQLRERRLRDFGPVPFDLDAFDQIVGDYAGTLDECNTLLVNNKKYRRDHQGFVYNIIWNLDVNPTVVRLRDKVAFHNVKILLIMETVEMKMMSDLEALILQMHQDQAERLAHIEKKIDKLHRIFKQSSQSDELPAESLMPEVPSEISEKFEKAISGNGQDMTTFPLEEGLNAFFRYFKDRPVTLDASSYLNLMKSMWIMARLLASRGFKSLPPGSLYDRCVREMNRKLRQELERTNRERIPFPDINTVLQLPEKDFLIWVTDPEVHKLEDEALEVLLDLSLPTISDSEHTLRVLQNPDGTLRLEDKVVTTTTTGAGNLVDRDRSQINFELAKAHLIPLYMHPNSTSDVPSLKFRGADGSNGITPTFGSLSDLLQFQHLITGYKTVGIRESITTTYYRKPEYIKDHGKLQIWDKTPFISDPGDTNGRETYNTLANSPTFSSSSSDQEKHLLKRMPSLFSSRYTKPFNSKLSRRGSSIHTEVRIGDSARATISDMPEPPLLVLFLERKAMGKNLLSFLVITMNKGTDIDPSACGCRKNPESCPTAVIRSKSGNLRARSFSTDNANDWNMAIFGAHWNLINSHNTKTELPWLQIDFKNLEEREKFDTRFKECRHIFDGKMDEYHGLLTRVRSRNIKRRTDLPVLA